MTYLEANDILQLVSKLEVQYGPCALFSADTQRKSVGLAPNIWRWKRLVSRNVEEFRLIVTSNDNGVDF